MGSSAAVLAAGAPVLCWVTRRRRAEPCAAAAPGFAALASPELLCCFVRRRSRAEPFSSAAGCTGQARSQSACIDVQTDRCKVRTGRHVASVLGTAHMIQSSQCRSNAAGRRSPPALLQAAESRPTWVGMLSSAGSARTEQTDMLRVCCGLHTAESICAVASTGRQAATRMLQAAQDTDITGQHGPPSEAAAGPSQASPSLISRDWFVQTGSSSVLQGGRPGRNDRLSADACMLQRPM